MKKLLIVLFAIVLFSTLALAQVDFEVLGPEAGSVAGVAVDAVSGYTYVSSGPGGFLRKGPDDKQFEVMNKGIEFGNYFPIGSGVAIPPNDPGYVLTSCWSTIYYSEDYGENWQLSNFSVQSSIGGMDFLNDSMVFVVDYERILHKSTDQGKNWTSIDLSNLISDTYRMELDPARQQIYVAENDTVIFSDDYGETWHVMPYTFPRYITQIYASQTSENLYISAGDSVFVTADNGRTFRIYDVKDKTYGICEHNENPDIFYVGTLANGVFRWDPAGQQLVQSSDGLKEVTLGGIYFPIVMQLYTFEGFLYATTDRSGLFRSDDDGVTWERIGMPVACVQQLLVRSNNSNEFITGSLKGVQLYEQQDWVNSTLYGAGLGFEVDVLQENPSHPDTLYLGGKPANPMFTRLMTSTDGGRHWEVTFYAQGGGGITSVAASPVKPEFVFVGINNPGDQYSGVFLSTDGATTEINWNPVAGTEGWKVGAIGISPTDYIIYVVNHISGDVNVSVDGGQTFQYLSSLPGSNHYITGIYFDELTGKIYVTGNGVFVSVDGGANWSDITPVQSSALFFSSLLTDRATADRLFAGSFGSGVYVSQDGGQSWNNLSTQLPNKYIGDLAFSNDNNSLYIGTYGASVLKYNLQMTGIEPAREAPRTFALLQNYPNPFNPVTSIAFRLAAGGKVSLKIYNTLGQEVATLVNGYRNAGDYHVEFNASDLPSGIYFYELQNGQNRMTRKMMLMK